MSSFPLVTIYLVNCGYDRYLTQAHDSIKKQTYSNIEVILFNNVVDTLPKIANEAIQKSTGDYILRLDADDWLHPQAIEKMISVMQANTEMALTYCNYYVTNEGGEILFEIKREENNGLLDIPCHGACTLVRTDFLKKYSENGLFYNESIPSQDGLWLWLHALKKKWAHIREPLFYYRKHPHSLSGKNHFILVSRRRIKERFFEKFEMAIPKPAIVIPVRESDLDRLNLIDEKGNSLLNNTLFQADNSVFKPNIIIATESKDVEHNFKQTYRVIRRPMIISENTFPIEPTFAYVTNEIRNEWIMLLHYHYPNRTSTHIDDAFRTMALFNADSVISVTKEKGHFYYYSKNGLTTLFEKRLMRYEMEDALYRENGAIFLTHRKFVTPYRLLGERVGHIEMNSFESEQEEL